MVAKMIQLNASGPAVKQIQQMLTKAANLKLKADGQFGPVMQKAVKAFQKANKLKPDGEVGSKTLAVLAKLAKGGSKKPKRAQLVKLNEKQGENVKAMEGQTKQLKAMQDQVGQSRKQSDELEKQIKIMEKQLASAGDDAQLANIDMQNMMQKQQQAMQMMSNISKQMHDTAMAVIRKIGG